MSEDGEEESPETNAVEDASRKTVVIVLSDRDRDRFLATLTNPPPPNAALRRAAERSKVLLA